MIEISSLKQREEHVPLFLNRVPRQGKILIG
jgi:hypothetical protein